MLLQKQHFLLNYYKTLSIWVLVWAGIGICVCQDNKDMDKCVSEYNPFMYNIIL